MRFLGIIGSLLLVLAFAAAPAMAADQSVTGSLVDILHTKGVIDDNAYKDLKNAEATGGEQTMNKKLIEVLHNKGVIDDATYGKLNEEAAKQAAAPAPSVPQASPAPVAAAPAERPFDKALTSLEEGFAKLGGDTVKLKIGTWTQLGFTADNSGSNSSPLPGSSAVTANSGDQFYVRFARLYFNFTLGEKMGFRIMVDGAGSPPLRDAFIWFDYIPYNRVTVGQYLTPFAETWRAPFDLPMINYSYQAQLMNFNFRDTGLLLAGKYTTKVKDMPLGFGYNMALVNGSGINKSDDNDAKDFLGRAWINPLVPGLTLTGEWYDGRTGKNTLDTTAGKEPRSHDVQRWGAEVDYVSTYLPGLQVRGEYLQQRKFYVTANALASASDPSQGISALSLSTVTSATAELFPEAQKYYTSAGWYVQASYRLKFLPGILSNFEPKIRYDVLDEDTSNKTLTFTKKVTTGTPAVTTTTTLQYNPLNNTRRRVTLGLNYWLNKYARVLVDYEWIHADGGLRSFSLLGNDLTSKQVFTTNLQIWF
jgi:hypothetical protein